MTYNLLADKYARGGWHGYCPPQHLTWDSRRERILQEIESYSSDIICLQEVEAQVFAGELQPWLAARGYRGHYLPRQYGDSVHGPPEGVALFYRTEVFDLEQQHSFLFNSVPTSPPAPGSMFKKRQEGAILALLRHRASKRQLLAACTHLFWNPAFADVKAFQATVLCSEMAGFLTRHVGPDAPSSVPVVLGGDFNSVACKRVPDVFDPKLPRDGQASGVYALLTRGSLPPSHPDHPASRRRPGEAANADFKGQPLTTSGIQLASSYVVAHGMDPPLTTRTNNFAGCLDYIFVSPRHFDVLRTLELPYEHSSGEEAPRGDPGRGGAGGGKGEAAGTYPGVRDPMDVPFPPIPNEVFPSDHLSLAVVLGLR
eukprot:XP_001690803.1 CCR4-NOT transcription complex, subunit 6-like protein [Chlamydomonas reinhardtii]